MKRTFPLFTKCFTGKKQAAKTLLSHILVPLFILFLYCVSFSFYSHNFLPKGVNSVFSDRFSEILLVLLFIAISVFILLLRSVKFASNDFLSPLDRIEAADLFLILLPLSPVIQYILNNQDLLSPYDSMVILGIFFLLSGLLIILIPWLLSGVGSSRVLKMMGATFTLTIVTMAILSKNFSWLGKGSLKIQLLFFACVFFITFFLYNPKNRWGLYLPVMAFFLSTLLMQFPAFLSSDTKPSLNSPSDFELVAAVGDKQPARKPNVYLLLYDAYVSNETMTAYGIDNSEQEEYLRELGFKLYPRTYSIFADTMRSMGRVLNASMEIEGDLNSSVSGDGKVFHLFEDIGYKTYGIFPYDFMFRGLTPKYDNYIPRFSAPPYSHLLSAILIGEFRFDIGFYEQDHSEFVLEKQEMLFDASRQKSFVYMHTNVPSHSQNSGACLPDEIDLYEDRLNTANREMRQDLDTILNNDPGALVIIAGDHGPYLTKNCGVLSETFNMNEISRLDIQDRYGTFLAIKWPDAEFARYDDITILQDLFPAIFAYLHQDPKILETKLDPVIKLDNVISGATVKNGIISGGINDSEPLFLSQ